VRIVLAEDSPKMAAQLCELLSPEFEVVATVDGGLALLAAVEEHRPDVVVTDIGMPDLDGITATASILARRPGTRVVLVTVRDELEVAEAGYAAGALGYVLKLDAADELVPAVRTATLGERYIPRAFAGGRPRRRPT
jgi:DNA-binding NarL/FixJ family response regulator